MRAYGQWRSEFGGALVELAVALPILVVVFVGTVDFARVFYTSMALNNAARAGAQYGAHDVARSGDNLGMKAAAENATGTNGITATVSRTCRCASDSGTFSSVDDCTAPASAPSPCDVEKGDHLVVTVTVVTTKTFTTIITGLPAIPGTVNLSRTATMRVHQ